MAPTRSLLRQHRRAAAARRRSGVCRGRVRGRRADAPAVGRRRIAARIALGASSGPRPTGSAACTGADLKASHGGLGGSSATRSASVLVTNKSRVTCTLRGRPGVRLLNGKNKILLDSATIKGIGGPKVRAGDPIVVLGPGDEVSIDVAWTNWCSSQPARPLTVNLVLTDRGGLLKVTKAKSSGEDDAPKCVAKSAGSELRVTDAWSGAGL